MVCGAAVRFQVAQVGVFGFVLSLVRHVDQNVEAVAFRIAADYRLELLFVQHEQRLDGFAKSVQKIPAMDAKSRAGLVGFRFQIRILCAHA
jgi:hypothetical protein